MSQQYRDFFVDSTHGSKFVESLYAMISQEQEQAETKTSPDEAFAHLQRSKGIRDVIYEIQRISVAEKEEAKS